MFALIGHSNSDELQLPIEKIILRDMTTGGEILSAAPVAYSNSNAKEYHAILGPLPPLCQYVTIEVSTGGR